MLATTENQIIALAGVFQAIGTVKQLAHEGRCEQSAFDSSIQSVLSKDADSVTEVFGDLSGISSGLQILKNQLESANNKRDAELSHYALTVIHLESRLRKNHSIFDTLKKGINRLESQVELNGMSDSIVENMAKLYQDSISQLTPRIMVKGEPGHLGNPYTASKIRASLLAAMRSAVLWRQCGGSRMKLLFKRNHHLEQVERLLERLND
jgi:high frequency lysogenization protein